MAVVELSAGIMSGLPARIIYPGTGVGGPQNGQQFDYCSMPLIPYAFSFNVGGGGAYNVTGLINIYQGTVPTDFSTLTAFNSRSADVLVSFNTTTAGLFTSTVNTSTNPSLIATAYQNASATGTATWFRWFTYNGTSGSNALIHQIIGTVGATGSGADLEISSTSIVSGRAYRIQTLRIQFPSSFTYT